MTWLGQVILDEAPGEGSHHPPHARVVASYLGGLDLCNGRYDTVRANLWTAAGAMCAPRHMQCRKCAGTATLIIISSNTLLYVQGTHSMFRTLGTVHSDDLHQPCIPGADIKFGGAMLCIPGTVTRIMCATVQSSMAALKWRQPGCSNASQLMLHHQAGDALPSCRSQGGMARHPLPPGGARCPCPAAHVLSAGSHTCHLSAVKRMACA